MVEARTDSKLMFIAQGHFVAFLIFIVCIVI